MYRRLLLMAVVFLSFTVSLNAQDQTLNDFMNRVIRDYVASRADMSQVSRQVEAPAALNMSTAVTDRAAASALVSTAINLAGFSASSRDDNPEANSAAVSVSAYSLYAAVSGVDPLNSHFYMDHAPWRRFWVTLGYEDPTAEALKAGALEERAKLVGFKAIVFSQREINNSNVQRLLPSLTNAAGQFGLLQDRVRALIFEAPDVIQAYGYASLKTLVQQELARPGLAATEQTRLNTLLSKANQSSPDLFVFNRTWGLTEAASIEERMVFATFTDQVARNFPAVLKAIGPDSEAKLQKIIEQEADAFVNLQKSTIAEIQTVSRKPQLAILATSKQRETVNEYSAKFAFDYGLANRVNATANGGFTYADTNISGGDKRGFDFSAQLEFEGPRRRITGGPDPIRFSAGVETKKANSDPWSVKGQAKLSLPLFEGTILPLSLTVAKRPEPNSPTDVRAQFGFTFDFARLASAIGGK